MSRTIRCATSMAAFGGRLGLIDIKPPGALAGRALPVLLFGLMIINITRYS
jgi:hypothetical protein